MLITANPTSINMLSVDATLLKNFRFECEYGTEYEYNCSIPVCRLYIITSHNNLIPGDFFSAGKQHKVLVLNLIFIVRSKGHY